MSGGNPPVPEEWSGSTGVPEGGAAPFGSGAPSRIHLVHRSRHTPKRPVEFAVRKLPNVPCPPHPGSLSPSGASPSPPPLRNPSATDKVVIRGSGAMRHSMSSPPSVDSKSQTLSRPPKTWLFRPECEKLPERASARSPLKTFSIDRGQTSFSRRGRSQTRLDQRALNASVKAARRQTSRESGRRPPAFLAAAQRRAATDDGRPPVDGR